MSKPVWKHTHNGEKNEELFECEGKYYEKFAWDHFLAAYTGKVRPAHRDRPPVADASNGWDSAWSPSVANGIIDFYSNGTDLWPADEKTDPMPQTVISPRQLAHVKKYKLPDDDTNKFLARHRAKPFTPEELKKIRADIDRKMAELWPGASKEGVNE